MIRIKLGTVRIDEVELSSLVIFQYDSQWYIHIFDDTFWNVDMGYF